MLTLSAAALSAAALSAAALSNRARACTEAQQYIMLRAQKMRANYLLSAARLLRLDSLLHPRLMNNRKHHIATKGSPHNVIQRFAEQRQDLRLLGVRGGRPPGYSKFAQSRRSVPTLQQESS